MPDANGEITDDDIVCLTVFRCRRCKEEGRPEHVVLTQTVLAAEQAMADHIEWMRFSGAGHGEG